MTSTSHSRRIVIVGAVAGGMSAATRLRRLDEFAHITVIEQGPYVSFANCGLPYYLSGVISDRNRLLVQTPEALHRRFNIDVRTNTRAVEIGDGELIVEGEGVRESIPFDDLVLSLGAEPVRPPIPGVEHALVVRNIPDIDLLTGEMMMARKVAVIGGGFIGVEVAENMRKAGKNVTLIESASQVIAPLDVEMVEPLHDHLRANGVKLLLGAHAQKISKEGVETSRGFVPAELVVMAVGVRPRTQLLTEAGIDLGQLGGAATDEQYMTSRSRVYALGDMAEKRDGITGQPRLIPLAGPANYQGRAVADVIGGLAPRNKPTLGTAIISVFGVAAGSTGWNEKQLKAAGMAYRAIHTHPANHATYYPGATQLSLKLLVDPDTDRILGAQAVGKSGVDKRIDVIATAMAGGLKASDLAELELAYAPPFGSAKDPINMLGYINANTASGMTPTVQWHEIDNLLTSGTTLIDVRTPHEFERGAIPGAINIPLDELRGRLDEVPQGKIVVSCAVGLRGHIATQILRARGREVANLDGGYATWKAGSSSLV